jgi:hypothetical protein
LPDVGAILDAMASQLQDALCGTADPAIEQLTVTGRFVFNPTPPHIDMYPADPFTEGISFNYERQLNFLVRARVSTADHEGGQDLLLTMMEPGSDTSVASAILSDGPLTQLVEDVGVDGPSGFGIFPSVGAEVASGSLLGCTWTVAVIP